MTGPNAQDIKILAPVAAAIRSKAENQADLERQFAEAVRSAVEYVIDPVRTARTTIDELDNVEKTFIGLKVEHFLREWLNVPRGKRDLVLGGIDVDVKNTTKANWMIPKETYDESGVCLLVKVDDDESRAFLGLLVAKPSYLNAPNRDLKRTVSEHGRSNIWWLVDGAEIGKSDWSGLDMVRFRELRLISGGSERAATFFEENVGRPVSRKVLESLLFDQRDPMKRLRENGGAPDLLLPKGIRLRVLADGSCVAERI